MPVQAAVFFMKKIDMLTEKAEFLEIATYTEIPVVGNYIQHTGQKQLGYRVEQVIYLQPNSEKWDIVIIAAGGSLKISTQEFQKVFYGIRNTRWNAEGQQYRDRKKVKEPDAVWQRRKNIYERILAGEKAEDISIELGIKPARVKYLASEWRHLLTRVSLYGPEEDKKDESSS